MKRYSAYYIVSLIVLAAIACNKMDDTYRVFLEKGETTYVGRADSILVYPGYNRIKLSWKLSPDPAVSFARVYWLNEGITDSIQVPVIRKPNVDTMELVINNLTEGDYVFTVRTFDDKGNTSVSTEKAGKIYGDEYLAFIQPTTLVNAQYDEDAGAVAIDWLLNTDTTAIGSKITYTNMQDKQVSYLVRSDEQQTVISDYQLNSAMQYQTLYVPDSLSIDTFYTAAQTIPVKMPNPNLAGPGEWSSWLGADATATNVTFTQNADQSFLATSNGSDGHAGIYKAIQVEANAIYKIDMTVKGTGATDAWFEVYVGKAVPAQGIDYSDGGKRISLNTWSGCGKTAFDDKLSNLSCSGNGNLVSFPTSGTVYYMIRTGGTNLGTGGINVSNIEFRKVD